MAGRRTFRVLTSSQQSGISCYFCRSTLLHLLASNSLPFTLPCKWAINRNIHPTGLVIVRSCRRPPPQCQLPSCNTNCNAILTTTRKRLPPPSTPVTFNTHKWLPLSFRLPFKCSRNISPIDTFFTVTLSLASSGKNTMQVWNSDSTLENSICNTASKAIQWSWNKQDRQLICERNIGVRSRNHCWHGK